MIKYLSILIIFLSSDFSYSQELKATMVANNEVELEIINNENYFFFMPYTEKLDFIIFQANRKKTVSYSIKHIIYKENSTIPECEMIIEFTYPGIQKFEIPGSGYFSAEPLIKQKYKIRFKICEYELFDNNDVHIQFVLSQENIDEINVFKENIKSFKKRLFNGKLYSNKILIKH